MRYGRFFFNQFSFDVDFSLAQARFLSAEDPNRKPTKVRKLFQRYGTVRQYSRRKVKALRQAFNNCLNLKTSRRAADSKSHLCD